MRPLERTSLKVIAGLLLLGIVCGAGLEMFTLRRGIPLLVPPYSSAVCLAGLAVILLVLALRLRRLLREKKRPVNPFHAVRLLAASRAGQLLGAFGAGAGGGMLLAVLQRSQAPATLWLPMVALLLSGLLLLGCARFAERTCRIPPNGENGEQETQEAPDTGEQAAYRQGN